MKCGKRAAVTVAPRVRAFHAVPTRHDRKVGASFLSGRATVGVASQTPNPNEAEPHAGLTLRAVEEAER